ncbi:17617_t:CDS:2, partial [Entrophospora sp. SA101]
MNSLAAKKFKDIDDGNLSEGEIYDSSNSSDLKLPRSPYPSSTYEDILDLRSPSSNNNVHQLRRTVSFSDLEVSRKHDLKMAPTRIIMDIQTYTIYVDLKQKEASLKNLIEQLMMISEEYSEHIEKLSNSYEEKFNNYKDTGKKGLEVLSKQKLIADRVNQIDTNSAKLNYELGVLEDKLKEMEEFIDNFCLKVKILESKMPQSPKTSSQRRNKRYSPGPIDLPETRIFRNEFFTPAQFKAYQKIIQELALTLNDDIWNLFTSKRKPSHSLLLF